MQSEKDEFCLGMAGGAAIVVFIGLWIMVVVAYFARTNGYRDGSTDALNHPENFKPVPAAVTWERKEKP